jgi:hypothetical protein
MHTFLNQLQAATSSWGARVHLMGHSFGTIVVSGMVGGPDGRGTLLRPVDSLVLVQGAVSLWCYASRIPYDNAGPGYFARNLTDRKVKGPIVTTQSRYDSAVGVLYPLASQIHGSVEFDPTRLPKYGAIGTYGLQGVDAGLRSDSRMLAASESYAFEKGHIYNLDGSQYISKRQGLAGAHSDIAGPEVAHAIWEAAFASK